MLLCFFHHWTLLLHSYFWMAVNMTSCPLLLSYSVGFTSKKSDHKKLKSVTSKWFCLTYFSSEDFKFFHDWLSFSSKNRTFLGLFLFVFCFLWTRIWPKGMCSALTIGSCVAVFSYHFLPVPDRIFMVKEGQWGHPWESSHCHSSVVSLICYFPLVFFIDAIKDKKSPHGYSKMLKGLFWWSFSLENKNRVGGCSGKFSCGDFCKNVGVDLGSCGFQIPAKGGCVGTQIAKVTCMCRVFFCAFADLDINFQTVQSSGWWPWPWRSAMPVEVCSSVASVLWVSQLPPWVTLGCCCSWAVPPLYTRSGLGHSIKTENRVRNTPWPLEQLLIHKSLHKVYILPVICNNWMLPPKKITSSKMKSG